MRAPNRLPYTFTASPQFYTPLSFSDKFDGALNFLLQIDTLVAASTAFIFYKCSATKTEGGALTLICIALLFSLKACFPSASLNKTKVSKIVGEPHKNVLLITVWLTYLIILAMTTSYLNEFRGDKQHVETHKLPDYVLMLQSTANDIPYDRGIILGPNGNVRKPFSYTLEGVLYYLTTIATNGGVYETGDDVSVVIPVRDEDKYIVDTVKHVFESTPKELLKEVIIIDDMSANAVQNYLLKSLPHYMHQKIIVKRNDIKEGLIRSRVIGADISTASNIFFLDGHCKPFDGWLTPLIDNLKQNYKRLACPVLYNVKDDWNTDGTSGRKMMFNWFFEFGWFEDNELEVPLSAGGIYAITRRWWEESGKYDMGMYEWGGENLEQSLRVWLCGGEIISVEASKIGHIFHRPAKPNPGNSLVRRIQQNQKRGALVWLDSYFDYFNQTHVETQVLSEGNLGEPFKLKASLNCRPFQWYADRFKTVMERKGLLWHEFHHLVHLNTGLCITADSIEGSNGVYLSDCIEGDRRQQWLLAAGGRAVLHRATDGCITSVDSSTIHLQQCDWLPLFKMETLHQVWHFHQSDGNFYSYHHPSSQTLSGNDLLHFPPNETAIRAHSVYCMEASDQPPYSLFVKSCTLLSPTHPQQFEIYWKQPQIESRFRPYPSI